MDRCMFCEDTGGSLKTVTARGLDAIRKCSLKRRDCLHLKLSDDLLPVLRIHDQCRKSYTDQRKIAKVVNSGAAGAVHSQVTVNTTGSILVDSEQHAIASNVPEVDVGGFSFHQQCLFCGEIVSVALKKDVAQLSTQKSISRILAFCSSATSELASAVKRRIVGVDLYEVRPVYHRKCYSRFAYVSKQTCSESTPVEHVADSSLHVPHDESVTFHKQSLINCEKSTTTSMDTTLDSMDEKANVVENQSDSTANFLLPPMLVSDCRSHVNYLQILSAMNSLDMVTTVGGGNCFFHAVLVSLRHNGVLSTIHELRNIAAQQLDLQRQTYEPLYAVEDDNEEQAPNFDLFLDRTRNGSEWATELTIGALARGLNRVIRVLSTSLTNDGTLHAFVRDYSDGFVGSETPILVGYNAAEKHYLGLISYRNEITVRRPLATMSSDETPSDNVLPMSVRICANQSATPDRGTISVDHSDVSPVADKIASNLHISDEKSVMFNRQSVHCCNNSMSADILLDYVAANADDDENRAENDVNEPMSVVSSPDQSTSQHSNVSPDNDNVFVDQQCEHEQCVNCERCLVVSGQFEFILYTDSAVRKKFCNYRAIDDASSTGLICSECITYVSCRTRESNSWKCAWPSVIASLLRDEQYSSHRNQLWNMLPAIYRQSWHLLAERLGLRSNDDPLFQDYTNERNSFSRLVTSGIIKDFLHAMKSYAFPCVKCPLGCFAYVDECSSLPFNDFLAWKFDVKVFGGEKKRLTGARNDWPSNSLQLDTFNVRPGIVVDPLRGLCILFCTSHGKSLQERFIHVPLNPILKDFGFQRPDTCAAAVLTPNVVRAGRMGRWTNSTHVIQAIGGYTGISSSTVSPKMDTCFTDERLAAAECLAITHRSDIFHIVHDRFVDNIADGKEEFTRMLRHYDLYHKPTVDREMTDSLSGATFVDVVDCFRINDLLFKPDAANSNGPAADKESHSMYLNYVHTAGPCGRVPVDLVNFRLHKSPIAGVMINLLVHCPYAYHVLLNEYNVSKNKSLLQLLQFALYCSGQQVNRSTLRTAKALQEALLDELPLSVRTESGNFVTAVELMKQFCATIVCLPSAEFTNLHNIQLPSDANLLLVYRSSANNSNFDCGSLRRDFEDFSLVAILGGSNSTEKVIFRWNERFDFWQVEFNATSQTHRPVETSTVRDDNWRLLVYARIHKLSGIDESLSLNISGQRIMWCDVHQAFLVKEPVTCKSPCCVKDCDRNARWGCLGRGEICPHSVCFCHAKEFCASTSLVNVEVNMNGRRLRSTATTQNASDVTIANYTDDSSDSENETPIGGLHSSDDESDSDVMDKVSAPIGITDFFSDEEAPPIHSRQDLLPIYDTHRNVPSHLLWNTHYNVMRRRSRFSDVRSNAILEHIVASTNAPSVSLLYPEGQLFPRIFWSTQSDSIVGALPSFILNTTTKCPLGIANLKHHQYVRIRDGDILTSRESPYWHYMFDVKLNCKLNKVPSQLVFKRGLEFMETRNTNTLAGKVPEADMNMDESEATRRIKELASLLKKGKWTYFMTLTVNDAETPGVREITSAIRRMADGDVTKESALTDSFLPFILRVWERFVRFFCQELLIRNPSIIGPVKNIFYRFEFQGAGAKGNKPHVHCGITLAETDDMISVSRICCNSTTFHTSLYKADYDTLLNEGLVSDQAEYDLWKTIVDNVNSHNCAATEFRCMKATNAAGEKICRYHRQPLLPPAVDPRGWFEEIPLPYTEEVYNILEELDLASLEPNFENRSEQWHVCDELTAGKWHYYSRSDEFFLSTIPLVSAICRSSTNVDMCDRKFQVSYLVKYITGKEEHQLVDVTPSKAVTDVKLQTQSHAHEKITGCSKLLSNKSGNGRTMGREICLAEVVWFVLDLPYTYCNANFIHVQTVPLESRTAILRLCSKLPKYLQGESVEEILSVKGRVSIALPEWRQFQSDQLSHIEDYLRSPYWCLSTSSFNVRPPELLFFDNLQVYCECFRVKGSEEPSFHTDLAEQPWFDGLSRRVYLRSCSIEKALSFVQTKIAEGNQHAAELLVKVFQPIASHNPEFLKRFVQFIDAQQVVSVISLVKPWDTTKFYSHLCMSLGRYRSEVDLFMNGSIQMAFVKAGLLQTAHNLTRADVVPILRRYVLEDLRFHPISARKFASYLKAASCSLNALISNENVPHCSPCINDVMIKEQADQRILDQEALRKTNLVSALLDDPAIRTCLPTNFQTNSPNLNWKPHISPAGNVTPQCLAEQNAALSCCTTAIDTFLSPTDSRLQFPCLVGRAGSGKSHVLKLTTAYALSKGLQVELMSLTSERARKLGGNHLHLVFPFVVGSNAVNFSANIALFCLQRLEKDPVKKLMLKRTDVFIFEEIGLLSAEYFSALDNVLRTIMENDRPMGGKLFISCGDSKQLPPIDGRPIWGSLNMCLMMSVFIFTQDVRARADQILQRLNSECRRPLTPEQCTSVADTVLKECQFAEDWSVVPDVAVRIVPTKAAEKHVMDQFLSGRQTTSFTAIDEVQNGVVWERASERVTAQLNKNCYEYDVCKLYVNAVVRMTYNCRRQDGSTIFSQGQVAVVVRLPAATDEFGDKRLTLRLAPPGQNQLISTDNWQEINVTPRTTLPNVVGRAMQMGRRTQFPVRYFLASTIHRIQGDTVPLLATEMSLARREYRMWQREQFAVLISRVQRCQDIIFVGNRQQTREAIEQILKRSSKWDALVEHYLSELNVADHSISARHIVLDQHPFLPVYRELPSVTCGYVYLLISMACIRKYYVGETMQLKRSLHRHNTGYGSGETRNTELHPWGVYGFIYGFDHTSEVVSGEARQLFCQEWRATLDDTLSADEAFAVGVRIANDWLPKYNVKLTTVKCGTIRTDISQSGNEQSNRD